MPPELHGRRGWVWDARLAHALTCDRNSLQKFTIFFHYKGRFRLLYLRSRLSIRRRTSNPPSEKISTGCFSPVGPH